MDIQAAINIIPLYAAILGLMFIPITVRVGFYRLETKIFIGDGGDDEMLRRMRGQANFIETVPLALILLLIMELIGASYLWLHGLGVLLVVGRMNHYLGLTNVGPRFMRPVGMMATLLTYLLASGWILYTAI